MAHTLAATVGAAHIDLTERVKAAGRALEERLPRREVMARLDSLLAPTARHASAFSEVMLPVLRERIANGRLHANRYLADVRQLERSLWVAKRRVYGEAHSQEITIEQVWDRLTADLKKLMATETVLLEHVLVTLGADERKRLGARLAAVEEHAPTRPHSHLPHSGAVGHFSRKVVARADRVWDSLEGRVTSP
jgi:Trp operon repressor